jgi:hypothetical protein
MPDTVDQFPQAVGKSTMHIRVTEGKPGGCSAEPAG